MTTQTSLLNLSIVRPESNSRFILSAAGDIVVDVVSISAPLLPLFPVTPIQVSDKMRTWGLADWACCRPDQRMAMRGFWCYALGDGVRSHVSPLTFALIVLYHLALTWGIMKPPSCPHDS
jgi:hypothetical protein